MSSVIASYAYDRQTARLTVRFVDGSAYEYRCAPRVWRELEKSPSKGSFFAAHIRDLKHRKLS